MEHAQNVYLEEAADAYLKVAAVPDELESDHHTADDSVRSTHSEKNKPSRTRPNLQQAVTGGVVCATETAWNHRRLCRGEVFKVIQVRRNKIKVIRYYEVIKKKNGARYYYRKKIQSRLRKITGRWCESCDHMFWSSRSCHGHNCQLR